VAVQDAAADDFDLPGLVRRVRRLADLSQRELAERIQVPKSAIAAAESGARGLDSRVLARAAVVAGLRVALVDRHGEVVVGMSDAAVRDTAGRNFPAHLDTRHGDDRWWHDSEPRYDRRRPWYTFDRSREARDSRRRRDGVPSDHQLPLAHDSPEERAADRRLQRLRSAEARRSDSLSRSLVRLDAFACDCPPSCEELDDRSGPPVHAPGCACLCDLA
jgi:transcriptional regulator with XRE-family HTH domain